ncbi:hypothetical protein B6D23_01735 [Gilliamella sp. N-W3]|uniref:phage tail-collar fiber domain-containing protein n=1 Tax=Gilliamella sp. N-W3 TaxID=1970474 RepID=UPI000A34C66A|nr:phage tail protein [Gilliamella sp. N-W3]OTQ80516.1 hypothetical protein B6D23_01735 [Gilliamella sp. N-W3]
MNQTYYTILTKQGAVLLANATALGVPLKITQMAVGDGNGIIPKPDANQTNLVHEVRRAAINTLFIDKENPNQIIAEQVIPESDGGWFIHEIGLFDDEGNLIAVGNCPTTYKPKLAEGSGRTQVIRMIIVVDNVNAVALKIDPSVVLATRQYVDDLITSKMTAHEKSTNHPNATTSSEGFVQLNSAIDSNLENQAATPLAVKKVYDLANGAVKKTGDTMTGQLILSKNGLKINYDNKNIMALIASDDNYSHVFYNAEKKQWLSKLIYNSTTNSWNFQYIDDVAINGKSVLKNGDAIQTFGDLFTTINLNDLTGANEGIYYQGRNVSAIEGRGYPINEAGTLQVFKNGADGAGCCQIYTTYRNARQFIRNYRGGTKTWEGWNEVITTGNSGSFIKKGDYGIGSFTGAQLDNPNPVLPGGCYATRTTEFPELTEFKNRDDSASLIVFPATTKNWCVEMLAVVQNILPRIFFRCATINGKQQLHEVVTTANINNYIPVGVPLPYPTNKPPAGWFECNGSTFDKSKFPKLANAYPSGYLPDLRGVFIRGLDTGSGLDPNRGILSYQGDAIRNIWGEISPISESFAADPIASGAFRYFEKHADHTPSHIDVGSVGGVTFDASRVVPTANENRPSNVAFMYIVKAE